jgi:hypothetical protein
LFLYVAVYFWGAKTHASVVVEKPTREMKVIDAKRAQHRPTFVYRRRFE